MERGVQHEAQRHRRTVRFQSTQTVGQIVALMKHCAGLLLVGAYDGDVAEAMHSIDRPVVRLGWVNPLERIDQVLSTDREAAQAVAHYLLGLGHRSIAFVFGSPAYRGRWERFYGAREVLERAGDATLHPIEFEEKAGGFPRALQALRARGVRPTAFFCAHDGLALTVISELLRDGIRIPEDASVVGFGDYAPAMQIEPQLTTVRVDGVGMGAAAFQRILIPARIVERASTGPLSVLAGARGVRRHDSLRRRATTAPPPGRAQGLGDRGLEALLRIGDDQLDAGQAAAGLKMPCHPRIRLRCRPRSSRPFVFAIKSLQPAIHRRRRSCDR
jgi:LacI family transcriptional regulator